MFFTILVLAAALVLEGLGSYISVVGLASKASPIIIFLAISLDFSKIMIATVLYKKWKDIHLLLRTFLIPALLFLMVVTSSGTYAFLLQEFSKTTAGQEQLTTKIELLNKEKTKLELRKKEIDGQIAQLPPSSVLQRKRMTDLFSDEITHINGRIIELDKEIPQSTLAVMEGAGHTGTLGSIAKAYGTTAEQINKIIAFLIVLVVDPLAIVLLTVANFLMDQRRKDRKTLLLQKLKGEMPLDEESLLEQLKNKVNFMRAKLSKENLSISNILFNSKNDLIKKPLMTGQSINLPVTKYVLSTNIVDNPKLYIPTKYATESIYLDNVHTLKESRPVVFKVAPEKSQQQLDIITIVNHQEVIEPTTIIEPLSLDIITKMDSKAFIMSDVIQKPISMVAHKDSITLPVSDIFLETKEPVSLTKTDTVTIAHIDHLQPGFVINNKVEDVLMKNIIYSIDHVKEQPLQKENNYFIEPYHLLNEVQSVEPEAIELELQHFITKIKNNSKPLVLDGNSEIISQDFIIENKNAHTPFLDDEEQLILNQVNSNAKPKKVQKPVPKSIIAVDPVSGGFFEDQEVKKFMPSNYEESPIYDDTYDMWEDERSENLPEINIHDNNDVDISGFNTTTLLKEKLFF